MKKILAQIALFVSLCVAGMSAFAGGPLNLAGPAGRTPVTYPNGGQNINMNLDQGNLGNRTKAQADANNKKVQEWEALMWKYQQALPHAKPGEKWMVMKKIFELGGKEIGVRS